MIKRYAFILLEILLVVIIVSFHYGVANPGQKQENKFQEQTGPQDEGDWFFPWCGKWHMGPGWRGHGMMYDYKKGPGWMGHRGYGMGPGMKGHPYDKKGAPVDKDQAEMLAEHYVKNTGNPNLKLGKAEEIDNPMIPLPFKGKTTKSCTTVRPRL